MLEPYSPSLTRSTPELALPPSAAQKLHAAWRIGFSLRARPSPVRPPRAWQEDIVATLPSSQKESVSRCIFFMGKARGLAAEGDIPESCRLFGLAHMLADGAQLSRKAALLCTAELQPAEAYLDFVCDDFTSARDRLYAAMDADQQLEEEFGHRLLHVHRVHLANNLVKVQAKAGDLTSALKLAAAILRYVDGSCDSLPLPTKWSAAQRDALSREARVFLAKQTTFEVASALAGTLKSRQVDAWQAACLEKAFHPAHSVCDAPLQQWFDLKRFFLEDDPDRFCPVACAWLSDGSKPSAALWQLVALDCLLFCRGDRSEAFNAFGEDVMRDLTLSPGTSRHVRGVLNKSFAHLIAQTKSVARN